MNPNTTHMLWWAVDTARETEARETEARGKKHLQGGRKGTPKLF